MVPTSKKTDEDDQVRIAGIKKLASLKEVEGNYRGLFRKLYGREPINSKELNTFSNRFQVNRGNPVLSFLGLCVSKYPELQKMTLGDFFEIKEDE